MPLLVLFRGSDLRLHDNPALLAAASAGAVVPAFIWSRADEGRWGMRGALEVYLKEALGVLGDSLHRLGSKLTLRCCSPTGSFPGGDGTCYSSFCAELLALVHETGADWVHYNIEHTPEGLQRDARMKSTLASHGVGCSGHTMQLLYDPEVVKLAGGFHGGHWGTLMPFLRACERSGEVPRWDPAPCAGELPAPTDGQRPAWPRSCGVEGLGLAPMPIKHGSGEVVDWGAPILERWKPGEAAAMLAAETFVRSGMLRYEKDRSRADRETSTSRLSVHLRFGELSPRFLYHAIRDTGLPREVIKTFSRRLHWRDLAYYHLACFPEMRTVGIRRHYDETRWVEPQAEYERRLRAWQHGRTGYPMVDAGMRDLYKSGWMPQAVRMVCASFLVEYLRVSWVDGAEWFHRCLVDADSAINAMMWQNAGRSGIDQWNMVLSPENASQDPTGAYVRQHLSPELDSLPLRYLHKPWGAPAKVLQEAGVVLGQNYPKRVVLDLAAERRLSVESVLEMRRANQKYNDTRGYDIITLPSGLKSKVFTKEEYRIGANGNVLPPPPRRNKGKMKDCRDPSRVRATMPYSARNRSKPKAAPLSATQTKAMATIKAATATGKAPLCELCGISCTSAQDMVAHLKGTKHLAKAKRQLSKVSFP